MAKPTKYPAWATNLVIDALTLAENKVEPTEEFKLSGLLRGEYLSRAFFNYQLDLINQWIEYSDYSSIYDLSGGTIIDRGNGYKQTITQTANTTFTEAMTDGEEVLIHVVSSGFTTTWPASFDFGNGSAPTGLSEFIVKGIKIGSTVYATTEWSKT